MCGGNRAALCSSSLQASHALAPIGLSSFDGRFEYGRIVHDGDCRHIPDSFFQIASIACGDDEFSYPWMKLTQTVMEQKDGLLLIGINADDQLAFAITELKLLKGGWYHRRMSSSLGISSANNNISSPRRTLTHAAS